MGGDMPNVTLQEINGPSKFTKKLEPGKSLDITTVWRGCFPSSISGYVIGANQENLLNNFAFAWNLRQFDATAPASATATLPASAIDAAADTAAAKTALDAAASDAVAAGR